MDVITVKKLNETYLHIECDAGIKYELEEYFKFEIPGAKFNPKVKAKVWDGFIRLFSIYRSTLYVGLFGQLKKFCDEYDYELKTLPGAYGTPGEKYKDFSPEEFKLFVDSLEMPKELTIRDYQYIAAYKAIRDKRHIIVSPTASGKSLIIYLIIRYLISIGIEKILLIVPTTQLVAQMAGDFHDYSVNLDHDIDKMLHQIYSGKEKEVDVPITISTWQSLQRLPPAFFTKYGAAMCDEVHLGKSAELSAIMEKCTEAEYKLGLTGSLDNSKTHKQMLIALYGDIIKEVSTRELIDRGYLSNIAINCLLLKYSKETSAMFKKIPYDKEISYINAHERRNKFIRNLVLSLKGNTLVLFTYIDKHGQILYDLIKNKDPDREVYFIHGKTDVEDRESIRHVIEAGNDIITIASVGVFSTGTNIKRLNNVVFASPTKSVIRVVQSIGRGLRKAHDKEHFVLYDIADDLTVTRNAKKNYTYEHFKERLKIYNNEQFQYTITEIEIES